MHESENLLYFTVQQLWAHPTLNNSTSFYPSNDKILSFPVHVYSQHIKIHKEEKGILGLNYFWAHV